MSEERGKTCIYTYHDFDPGDGDLVCWYVIACSGHKYYKRDKFCPECGKPTELAINTPAQETAL